MPRTFIGMIETTGDDSVVAEIDTDLIAQLFSCVGPQLKNAHPAIIQITGLEGTSTAATANIHLDSPAALGDKEATAGNLITTYQLNAAGNRGTARPRKSFLLRSDAAGGSKDIDRPPEPIEVWNKIHIVKPAATTWTFIVDFMYVKGALDFRSEMAELYDDIRQISPERSAGGIGFQPTGRVRQVGGLGGEDK